MRDYLSLRDAVEHPGTVLANLAGLRSEVQILREALQRERERSSELARRAAALEEAVRRAYRMVVTPRRRDD